MAGDTGPIQIVGLDGRVPTGSLRLRAPRPREVDPGVERAEAANPRPDADLEEMTEPEPMGSEGEAPDADAGARAAEPAVEALKAPSASDPEPESDAESDPEGVGEATDPDEQTLASPAEITEPGAGSDVDVAPVLASSDFDRGTSAAEPHADSVRRGDTPIDTHALARALGRGIGDVRTRLGRRRP